MSDDDAYQGWPNRESWALALWLGNDKGLYDMTTTLARDAENLDHAAEVIENWVTELLWDELLATDEGRLMIREVGSIWRVDWRAVTEHIRTE